jgi:hypothetical protein
MSQTSHLAPLPPGAAIARLSHPTGACFGGGRGARFPLVGQSEPDAIDGVGDETARIAHVTAARGQCWANERTHSDATKIARRIGKPARPTCR